MGFGWSHPSYGSKINIIGAWTERNFSSLVFNISIKKIDKIIIDTKNWDNSIASNSPGQSGNPESIFYDNLYESWANDEYFKLLFCKEEVNKHIHSKTIY